MLGNIFNKYKKSYEQVLLNLPSWQQLSSQEKQKSIEIIINYYCSKLSLSRVDIFFKKNDFLNTNIYYSRKEKYIKIDPVILKNDLPKILVDILHEIKHKQQFHSLDKKYTEFARFNPLLSEQELNKKFENNLKTNEKHKILYNLLEYKDFINVNNAYMANYSELLKIHINKVTQANYCLQPCEIDAERFAHENMIFILRSAFGETKGNNKQEDFMYSTLKQGYARYANFKEEIAKQEENLYESKQSLKQYFNNELEKLQSKYSWKNAVEIINICSVPQLKDIIKNTCNIDKLTNIVLQSADTNMIAYLSKMPFININQIRNTLIKSKDTGAIILFDYHANVDINETLNTLENCKINDSNLSQLQLLDKKITEPNIATKLFLMVAEKLSLECLRTLTINSLVDKELWANTIRKKVENNFTPFK
jgi:hypothetical protein